MAGYNDLENLDHAPTLATALGNMVVAWARAESILVAAFARVTGIDINMAIMGYYRIPSYEARTKFLSALLTEWKTEKYQVDQIATEIAGLNRLAAARNDWVHGVWCANASLTETVIFDFRKPDAANPTETGRRKPVKTADVSNHVRAVLERSKKLDALVGAHALFHRLQ